MKLYQRDEMGNTAFVSVDETKGKKRHPLAENIIFGIILLGATYIEGLNGLVITGVIWFAYFALNSIMED